MTRRRKFTVEIHDRRGGYTHQLARDEQEVSLLLLTVFDDSNVDSVTVTRRP